MNWKTKLKLTLGEEESPTSASAPIPDAPPEWDDIYIPSDEELEILSGNRKREFIPPQEESEAEFLRRLEQAPQPQMYPDDWIIDETDIPPEREEPEYEDAYYDDFEDLSINEQYAPPEWDGVIPDIDSPRSEKPKPAPTLKDDEILIEPEMLTGRKSYVIKEDYLDEILDKIFERLDIPVIEYKAKAAEVKEVAVYTGGGLPASLEMVTENGTVNVPLGEHEQDYLEESVSVKEQEEDKEK